MNRAAMEFRQLRQFIAVVDAGSFTDAAARTGLTQPALSQSIARLERELGCRLLVRPRSGPSRAIAATPAGAYLREEAAKILDALDRMDRGVRRLAAARPVETVVLGFSPGVPQDLLAAALVRTDDQASVVPLQLAWGTEFDALSRGDADVALLQYPEGMALPGHTAIALRSYPLVALVSRSSGLPAGTLTTAELARLPILDPGMDAAPPGIRAFWLTGRADAPTDRLRTVGPPNRTVDEMLAFVAAGRGVAITSAAAVADGLPSSVLAAPVVDATPVTIGVVRLADERRASVLAVVEACRSLS